MRKGMWLAMLVVLTITGGCCCGSRCCPPPAGPDVSKMPAGNSMARHWSLEDGVPGSLPEDFRVGEGSWQIAQEGSARGLLQSAANEKPVFNVVLVDGTRRRDVDISVDVRALQGTIDQGGGPMWRARDASNYYIARWNPLEDNCRVYKVVDGVRTQLGSADTAPGPMARSLRIVMQGDRIRCWLDDALLVEVEDETFPDAGLVGLWAKADARTLFSNLNLRRP